MTGSTQRPLLFVDVDGPLLPFCAPSYPAYPTYSSCRKGPEPEWADANPLLVRINPEHGLRLAALPCELVWATAWMEDANEFIAPLIGLPELPVVSWPDSVDEDEQTWRAGLHWKTRALLDWAAGRPFAWIDDETTDNDRAWVRAHYPAQALLHHVDPCRGLTDADFAALDTWLSAHGQ
ncbi:hypothetical protein P3T36_002245 [Kitasatospora sp. MAP12-15]|uniref:HAD domain-containing protein n=1 Tax=unclassified Kitasatospora TaxID=2633591 RepID=UPI002475A716|nr:HAD domain-containing protein [Kitasatospora sp. MAP12-44]MDH6108875.1 hypothetical protein [Kitasatospora sp. MAP12-44]